VVIALIVTSQGSPLTYEVLSGNTADARTLPQLLECIEALYSKARRIWVDGSRHSYRGAPGVYACTQRAIPGGDAEGMPLSTRSRAFPRLPEQEPRGDRAS